MAGLTSLQLNKILDINAKSVEIYLEVETRYSEILEKLEDLNKLNENNCQDNKEHIKEQYLHIERMKNVMDKMQEMIDINYKSMIKQNSEVVSSIVKMEKDLSKQNYIFGGTILSAVIAAIIKIFFGL